MISSIIRIWMAKPLISGVIFIAVGILFFSLVTMQSSVMSNSNLLSRFYIDSETISQMLQKEIDTQVNNLISIQRYANLPISINSMTFSLFVTPMLGADSCVQAFEWIPAVPNAQREQFVQTVQQQGSPGYTLFELAGDGQRIPAMRREYHYPVFLIEPFKGNESAVGYDLGSNPVRLAALNKAKDSGEPVVTDPVTLVQEAGNQFGFLIFCPVYADGQAPPTVEERRATLRGFAVGVFRTGDILTKAIQSNTVQDIELELIDPHASSASALMHRAVLGAASQADATKTDIVDEYTITLPGTTWILRVTALPLYLSVNRQSNHWYIFIIGILLSFVVGFIIYYIGTERQRSEKLVLQRTAEIQERGSYLRSLLDNFPFLMWMKDTSGRFLAVNRQFAEACGRDSPDSVVGLTDLDVWPEDLALKYRADDAEVVASRMPRSTEELIEVGEKREWNETYKSPLWGANGMLRGTTGFAQNITVRKQAEEEIKRQAGLINSLLDSIPDIIFFKNSSGVYLGCNPPFAEFVGRPREEIIGRTDFDLFDKDVADSFRKFDKMMLDHFQTKHNEEWITYPNGRRILIDTMRTPYMGQRGELIGILGISRDITESSLTQDSLRKSEEKVRLILESTGEAIYGIDLNGLCTFCNPSCLRQLGYSSQEDLLGKNMHMLIHHTRVDGSLYAVEDCRIFRAFREGQGAHVDDEVLWRADGSSFPAEYWAYPQILGEEVVGGVVAFVDITEKKQNQERLLRLNERFQLAVTSAEMGVWDWDIVRDKLVWDSRMYALYGATKDDFAGVYQAWLSLVHPDDRERCEFAIRKALSGEKAYDIEFRVAWPDGEVRYIKASAQVIRDGSGKPLRMTGVNFDISQRKRSEQALQESEEKFRAMSEASNDALIMIDAQDTILFWNTTAEKIFGYAKADAVGKKLHQLITHPADQTKAYLGLERFANTGTGPLIGNVQEFMALRKGGLEFPVERSVAAFTVRGAWYAVGTLRDVSERKEVDRLKKEFISTVSHELRTPLTSIQGSLGLVMGTMAESLPEHSRQLLRIAVSNTTRLIALINDLLTIEKLESGRMSYHLEQLDLYDLVSASLDDNRNYAVNHGVTFHLSPRLQPFPAQGDRDRLAQVMANLLSNAAKYSPSGGRVEVSLAANGQRTRVSVRDYGPGVPEDFRSRIFQKFAQADASDARQRGGTGLGLSIVKEIIQRLGGEVGYQSAEGGGTIFYFELPSLGNVASIQGQDTSRDE